MVGEREREVKGCWIEFYYYVIYIDWLDLGLDFVIM